MKFLRTQYAALFGIILILLATVKHSFEVYIHVMFPQIEPTMIQMVYIAVMLIAVDYAVLLFTLHGNDYAARSFAFFIFLVNLFAFCQHIPFEGWDLSLLRYFPGFLFSCMFSYGLYYFTDLFSGLLSEDNRIEELEEETQNQKSRLSTLEKDNSKLEQARKGAEELLQRLYGEKENLNLQLIKMEESQEETHQKADRFDMLLSYIIEAEGYLEKTPQALKKGMEYWRKRVSEGDVEPKNLVKQLAYETAYNLRN